MWGSYASYGKSFSFDWIYGSSRVITMSNSVFRALEAGISPLRVWLEILALKMRFTLSLILLESSI